MRGERTPERLREFRTQYASKRAPVSRLLVLQLLVLLAGFAGVFALLVQSAEHGEPPVVAPGGGLSAEALREYAVYLAERQQPTAAIGVYRRYLDKAALEPTARAKVCYSMAKLAIDAEQFNEALKYLYQAEFLAPESDLKDEIDKKVVLCLDKLGRRVDLRKELRKRTTLERRAEDIEPGEIVLAEFAGEVITDRDLALETEKLPAYMRDSLNEPGKKAEFLKNLVAQRLLVDKARRLELGQDPEIQERMAKQLDVMMVQKLITDEVQSRIHITPEDVERFYKASIERFTEPEKAEVRVGQADTAEALQALEAFPEEPVTVRKGGRIPGVPESREAEEAIFAAEEGSRVGPYELEGTWHAFEVVSKTPERVKPFEEVRDQAQRMFQLQKEQEELSALIERILKERDVRLHLDRLKEQD